MIAGEEMMIPELFLVGEYIDNYMTSHVITATADLRGFAPSVFHFQERSTMRRTSSSPRTTR